MRSPVVLFWRVGSRLRKAVDRVLSLRPSSDPYVSGDSFRSLAQHTWDESEAPNFRPEDVRAGDVVFVSWYLGPFLLSVAPQIPVPFVLISSNSDQTVTAMEASFLERTKVITWFAVNVAVRHPRIVPIPLGLENLRFRWYGDRADFRRLARTNPARALKICWGFAVENNPTERTAAKRALETYGLAEKVSGVNAFQYRRLVRKFGFVASPPGNGPDCHRTWEALYLGILPIVKRSALTEGFVDRGLPLIQVEDWSELQTWDEQSLQRWVDTLTPALGCPALYFSYWKDLILKAQKTVREGVTD